MIRRFDIVRRGLCCIVAAAAALSGYAAPKYVFYFIGDGMGLGHIAATEAYLREQHGGKFGLTMTSFPVAGMCSTYSASSPVTDSAAAGTALATGTKTRNYMLGNAPDSTALKSVASTLKEQGYGVGIVTSVAPDDATPGAFYAHVDNRKDFYQIGCDMASSGFEFFAGSNLRGLGTAENPTDLPAVLKASGIDVVRGADAARQSTSRRVLMLNTDSIRVNHIGYTIDSLPGVLSLPVITETALAHLQKYSPDRFFLMVEGGNIDYAAHGNDGGAVIKEILNFDEAIRLAYDFYLQHPDETLIVVTADHDTGGVAAGDYSKVNRTSLSRIDNQRMSKDRFGEWSSQRIKEGRMTWEEMQQFLSDNFGLWSQLPLTERQTERLREKFEKAFSTAGGEVKQTWYNDFNEFAVSVFDVLNSLNGLYWPSDTHVGNFVPVYAIGCGAGSFTGINDNSEIAPKILRAK